MERPSSTSSLPRVTLAELARLLEGRGVSARCEPADTAAHVQGMTVDSREVRPRNLFVCKGAAFRPAFLASAVEAGAAAYLCSDDPELLAELTAAAPTCPRLVVSDVRRAMALVAPAIYDHPERALTVCGITGTKGKSTVAYMLRSILLASGDVPSILGSIETDDGVESYESHNTTPEAPELWRHLRNTVDAGRTRMVMEVSSQGLKYDRVLGLPFDIACFLNIGRDHISSVEHPTFEDYFASKLRIFEHAETAVVNLATEHVDAVLAAASHAQRLVTVRACHENGTGNDAKNTSEAAGATSSTTTGAVIPTFEAKDIRSTAAGLAFDVLERDASGALVASTSIALGMAGLFNVDNALAAIACAHLMGVDYAAIAAGLAHVRVPGRMELVPSPDGKVLAIVDYAHNELSFETLFSSVKREYPGRRVIALFGAPGGKAQERREALPRVASKYADLIIYTEEDPAHERVEDICAELAANTPAGVAHKIICDREQAVSAAIEAGREAPEGAVVLLLAKGDETRQHRGDDYPEVESDLSIARRLLSD
ncbi:MAG TPA: UDP-N-acetylmuramoyl-L-alanyl-D-glutamate--2,6-diaminopimelate ligase [Candidatus Olsenella pullicola]|nr:UDP-N-acetylmuramoyl-L-alanyl-D-glutamate--2,6-diaminopimelate ligase [Candidatus Limicola stercorigallinarum]HJA29725.1 UDP-N-acetylmuramoyl-L-alanyl-D-glutamate--2,6-diaminopimelate ligase [Candidatus Olsenella pullicola]